MNGKIFRQRAIRHGEMVIVPIDRLPKGLEQVETGKKIIIGHSESGHHHVAVCDGLDLVAFRPAGADSADLYLQVSAAARIEHLKTFDRHETKLLQPGYYSINTKAAYDYFLKRQVAVTD